MALELSTMGIKVEYLCETETKKGFNTIKDETDGWTAIPNLKSIPDLNPQPDTLEVTDLSDHSKRYIEGLKDVGGALEFSANFTKKFATVWEKLVSDSDDAKGKDLQTFFKITVSGFGAYYFAGDPAELGLPSAEVGAVFEGNVYITPNAIHGWVME